jgi:hypothetical protein
MEVIAYFGEERGAHPLRDPNLALLADPVLLGHHNVGHVLDTQVEALELALVVDAQIGVVLEEFGRGKLISINRTSTVQREGYTVCYDTVILFGICTVYSTSMSYLILS